MPSPSRYSKWLLTGGTGTLGLAIKTALAKSGIEAMGVSRRGSEYVLENLPSYHPRKELIEKVEILYSQALFEHMLDASGANLPQYY